jgi:Protein of Unknown function (DUF2784)
MVYRLLADAVLVVHLIFIAFVVLGGLLVLRWPGIAWLHLPAVAWGAWIEFAGWICPLTPLEADLRARAGDASYAGGFIEHYLTAAIYPEGLDRRHQVVLGAFVLVLNAAVYGWLAWRRRSRVTKLKG